MGSIFKFSRFHNVVLSGVLIAFCAATLNPHPLYPINLGVNDIGFGIKLQTLIDKAWNCHKKMNGNGLLDVVLDLKTEIESYTGRKIDLDKEISKIESDLKRKGGKPPSDIFKKFKSLVKNKDNKRRSRALCMEAYFRDGLDMNFEDYLILHSAATIGKQANEQTELPLKFVVAVSLILGGAFVMFATPVCPMLGYAGETMMGTGFAMLLDQSLDIYEKQH
jgi:hypothetical protein